MGRQSIYLNNAASSHPKPRCVVQAVAGCLEVPPSNHHRGGSHGASKLEACRSQLARFVSVNSPERVILTSGATDALNLALNGLIDPGKHVVTTRAEHNSVLRPLHSLAQGRDVDLTWVNVDRFGYVDADDVAAAIRPETVLLAVNHVSNVTGAVQNIPALYAIAELHGVALLIDGAQSLGSVPLDLSAMPLAALAFTGHKSLLGPAGTGGVIFGSELNLRPWKSGGTGVHSESPDMPEQWPIRFEPGTPNYPGFAGLSASLDFLEERGFDSAQKRQLLKQLSEGLAPLDDVSLHFVPPDENPSGVLSFTVAGWNPTELAYFLDEAYGIQVRGGLHCAPLIHSGLGTFPEGTIRASLSIFSTEEDVEALVSALTEICSKR